jgi:hypothetical protein
MLGEALCIKNYDFGVGIGIARKEPNKDECWAKMH